MEKFIIKNVTEQKFESIEQKHAKILELLKIDQPYDALELVDTEKERNLKWHEKMQREILRYFCEAMDEEGAVRIIEETVLYQSQQGRIKKYENVFGKKYTGLIVEDGLIEDKNPSVSDLIRNAIYEKDYIKAEKLLDDIRKKILDENDDMPFAKRCEMVDHREDELFNAYIKAKMWEEAQKVIDTMITNSHNQEYNSKEGRQNYLNEQKDKE